MQYNSDRELLFRFYQLGPCDTKGEVVISDLAKHHDKITRGMNADWLGQSPERYGFIRIVELDDGVFGGAFCLEYIEQKSRFDAKKKEETVDVDAFEKRLFVWDVNRMLVALDCTRFVSRTRLTPAVFRERFAGAVAALYLPSPAAPEYPLLRLEMLRWRTTKEQFIDMFMTKRVTKIAIDFDPECSVPDDLVVYNPHFDRNQLMVELGRDFLSGHPERMVFEMNDSTGDAGRKYLAKLPLLIGNPREAEYEEDGEKRYLKRDGLVEQRIGNASDDPQHVLITLSERMRMMSLDNLAEEAQKPSSTLFDSEVD